MKNLLKTLVFLIGTTIICTSLYSQAPQKIDYQAVVRNGLGKVIENQNVSLRFSIINTSVSGQLVFQEIHNTTTNEFGLVTLEIGTGNSTVGTFESIDWSIGSKFLKVEFDIAGGVDYMHLGTTQRHLTTRQRDLKLAGQILQEHTINILGIRRDIRTQLAQEMLVWAIPLCIIIQEVTTQR